MTCRGTSSAESVDLRIHLVREERAHDGARPCRVLDESAAGPVWRDALDLGARWRWVGAGDLGLALVHVLGESAPRRMAIERIEGHEASASKTTAIDPLERDRRHDLGKRLRQMRDRAGLSRDAFALLADVLPTRIEAIESGDGPMPDGVRAVYLGLRRPRGPQQGSSRHAAALALRRRCPVCHEPAGTHCRKRRDASGRVTEVLHAERLTEVQA